MNPVFTCFLYSYSKWLEFSQDGEISLLHNCKWWCSSKILSKDDAIYLYLKCGDKYLYTFAFIGQNWKCKNICPHTLNKDYLRQYQKPIILSNVLQEYSNIGLLKLSSMFLNVSINDCSSWNQKKKRHGFPGEPRHVAASELTLQRLKRENMINFNEDKQQKLEKIILNDWLFT